MSLQVWLPFNGDLQNRGLTNIPFTNVGASVHNGGKIGPCYSFNGSSNYLYAPYNFYKTSYTVAGWIYTTSGTATQTFVCDRTSVGNGFSTFLIGGKLRVDAGGNNLQWTTNYTYPTSTWFHLAVVYKDTTVSYYINGEFKESKTQTISSSYWGSTTSIGASQANGSGWGNYLLGRLNDVRIYDHALSEKEVKELAKGLVLHYKLDDGLGVTGMNLIRNGFGELGSENWSNPSYIYPAQIPSGHPEIKASFTNNNHTTEYIPFDPTHVYKFELYMKTTGNTSNCYPSLMPYDIDKKFINFHNSKEGFNLNTMTVLTKNLNSGDAKIYVESLANWNANSGHYYNYAAIFGYRDSTGHLYPDGEYTQITPAFGSGTTAKTNLDKTNNIITLNTAYSGPTIPSGTHVCASTEGSTYYYPVGGVSSSTIADWTYKTATFSSPNRLSSARFLLYLAYDNAYQAGIKLTDKTIGKNLMPDVSGYSYHGTIGGATSLDISAARYGHSSHFEGTSSYIKTESKDWMVSGSTELTINFWAKTSNWTSGRMISCTESGGFNIEPGNSGYLRFPVNAYINADKTSRTYIYDSSELQISAMPVNQWVMITCVYNATTGTKTYINGVLHHTYSRVTYGIYYNPNARFFIGCEANTASPSSPYFNGSISDFRMYSTALSAEDILELYQTSGSIDNQGNAYAREVIE